MYGYYFLAALGPHMRPYLWWKKYLTTFQMVQFVCIFLKSLVVVLGVVNCAYPWQFSFLNLLLVTLMFGLFAEFYVQEYRNKAAKRQGVQKSQ
jgi:elongation of very long chain fatty acids protein 1/elongation of very long chain fatty acids protein 7